MLVFSCVSMTAYGVLHRPPLTRGWQVLYAVNWWRKMSVSLVRVHSQHECIRSLMFPFKVRDNFLRVLSSMFFRMYMLPMTPVESIDFIMSYAVRMTYFNRFVSYVF